MSEPFEPKLSDSLKWSLPSFWKNTPCCKSGMSLFHYYIFGVIIPSYCLTLSMHANVPGCYLSYCSVSYPGFCYTSGCNYYFKNFTSDYFKFANFEAGCDKSSTTYNEQYKFWVSSSILQVSSQGDCEKWDYCQMIGNLVYTCTWGGDESTVYLYKDSS